MGAICALRVAQVLNPMMPQQGLEDELNRDDWQSSAAAAQAAPAPAAPSLPPPPPSAALPPPPPTAARTVIKMESASDSVVRSSSTRVPGAATGWDAADRNGGVDVAAVDGASDVAAGVWSAPASAEDGAVKQPLGLGKRKRKDTGLDEPMYRRAEAAVMESLWCEHAPGLTFAAS